MGVGSPLMLTLADLSQAIEAYRSRDASLDQFVDWYRLASLTKFGESAPVLEACLEIDSVIAQLEYEKLSEQQFLEGLENAVRPFVTNVSKSSASEVRELEPLLEAPPRKRSASEYRVQ